MSLHHLQCIYSVGKVIKIQKDLIEVTLIENIENYEDSTGWHPFYKIF